MLGTTPFALVYNGLDVELLTPLLEQRTQLRRSLCDQLGVSPETILVAGVGRLHRQKAFDFLIEAVNHIVKSKITEPFHVILVGDGKLRTSLESQAKALGVENHLTFLGWQDQAEAHRLLVASDLLTLPSRFECFPYSLLEAIAAGLPVVATDVGGNAEAVLHEHNGLVVPSGDVHALASALSRLIQDSTLREQFRAHYFENARRFTAANMANQTAAFLESILAPSDRDL